MYLNPNLLEDCFLLLSNRIWGPSEVPFHHFPHKVSMSLTDCLFRSVMMTGIGNSDSKRGRFLGLLPDFENHYNKSFLPSKCNLNAG